MPTMDVLNLEGKKVLVSEVSAVAATAQSLVAAEYRGLTVGQMTDLRAKARAADIYEGVLEWERCKAWGLV